MKSLATLRIIFYKLSCFIFLFSVLLLNVNAEDEPLVQVTCTYSSYVVKLTDGEISVRTGQQGWSVNKKGITQADFLDPQGNYMCKETLYYRGVTQGRTATLYFSYRAKDSTYSYLELSPMKLTNEEIIDNRSNDEDSSYKVCPYGPAIVISYNDKDVKISTTNNATMLASFSPDTFKNGCPSEIHFFIGGGFQNLSFSDSAPSGWSTIKLKDIKDLFTMKCSFADVGGKKISIVTDGSEYFVAPWFDCDTSNFDKSEMKYGCMPNLFYKTEKKDGKNICYFTFDESKGYPNVAGAKSDNQTIVDSINCDDFTTDKGVNMIQDIFNLIMIIGPILAIVLGVIDFAKASLQSDEGALKKAGTNFGKRLIAAVLLFLLPLIIGFILEIAFDAGVLENIPEICID